MPSDAFIGILTGLGEAHRERQKNIFDQEVERRSKYEQFLQKAATDPAYRPEAQNQFAELYSTLIQTPYEKKLPKDFERQVSDALTSVEGSMDLSRGGPPEKLPIGHPVEQRSLAVEPPPPFQGRVPARFSAKEKFAEAMRLLNAELEARGRSALDVERQKIAMQPDEFFAVPPESGIARRSTGELTRQPQFRPMAPDRSLSREELAMLAAKGDPTAKQALELLSQDQTGRTLFERLGPEKYYEMIQKGAEARAGVTDDTVSSYVNAINEGNVSNISQVPQIVRSSVLSSLGDGFIIAPGEREGIRKIDMAGNLLDRLETYSKKVSENPGDVESALVLRGLRQAVGGVFAKGIFAEAGVLTDYDISRVQALIPSVIRSIFMPGTSEKQFAELRGIINDAKANYGRSIGSIVRGDAPTTPPTEGADKAPPGVDQAVWDVMTPQERALWK